MKPLLLVDMPESVKSAAAGTNGSTDTHTITESITGEDNAESNESNAETETTPAAIEQTEAVVEVVKKPANGKFRAEVQGEFIEKLKFFFYRCR